METNAGAAYRAYMLRLWLVRVEGGATWRASLEDARTRERRGFVDLEALLAWLRDEAERAGVPTLPASQ